jgi:hypothetical protein
MTERIAKNAVKRVVIPQEETASKPDGAKSNRSVISTRSEGSDPKPQIFDQIIIGDKDVGIYKNTILKTLTLRKSTGTAGITYVVAHKKYLEKAILSVGFSQMEFQDKLFISMSVVRETSKLGRNMIKIIFGLSTEANQ